MRFKLISIILIQCCCLFFSFMGGGVVEAEAVDSLNVYAKQEGAWGQMGCLNVYDVSCSTHIKKKTFSAFSESVKFKMPYETKFHQIHFNYEWADTLHYDNRNLNVYHNTYNGGDMNLVFGKDYDGSDCKAYSYVYGDYYVKDTDGTILELHKVTKDQAKSNFLKIISWNRANEIRYHANITNINETQYVGDSVLISGKMCEENPSFNGVSYGNNLGGITFDLVIYNSKDNKTLKNTTIPVTTQSDGSWSTSYTPLTDGTYYVEAYWKGDKTHPIFTPMTNKTLNQKTFKAEKRSINSTINLPEETIVNKPIIISGESSPGIILNLTINDETMNVNTDNRGCWSTEYTPTIGGVHTITVSLKNHYMYKDFKNTTTLIVHDNRINLNSTINLPEKAIIDEEFIISGVLKDEHGKTVPKTELKLTINNENYTVTTDKNGYWSLPYTPQTIGEHKVTISLRGHPYFYDFTNTTTFQCL